MTSTTTIKFLCSYGGMILPRYPDGKLRYQGGDTRVLAVERSISFSELVGKLVEMCGEPVVLRCQLPAEEMDDALVTITSDEDLANLIDEYDRIPAGSSVKVRAFLITPKSGKKMLSRTSSASSSSSTSSNESISPVLPAKPPRGPAKCNHHAAVSARPVMGYPQHYTTPRNYGPAGKSSSPMYLIHHGNHWQ